MTFCSSDNVGFKLHRANLASHSVVFPDAGAMVGTKLEDRNDIVRLEEPACVLELLFQFVYPRQHRELDGLEFELLDKIAEASEKYQLFAAMALCRISMRFVHF